MKQQLAFDQDKYLKIQKKEILSRISKFDKKLYLEFGGKLLDDYHASRVLPGFEPDAKAKLLLSLKDMLEVIIVVNADDIIAHKVRNDNEKSYEAEVERMIKNFSRLSLPIGAIVLSFYKESPLIEEFMTKMHNRKIKVYKHYAINGYPKNIPLILSEQGLGRNEYVETKKPLVVVTAPGPGSGKMATCLSQLYHDNKRGTKSGYAKYETFPIWNLPLKHPINLAYEAATVDIDDVNMIDPYHLEHYGVTAVNYNRDVETFPLLKTIFDNIYGNSPYFSPTDMGVNMAGFAIKNNDVAIEACKHEIIRRYYSTLKNNYLGRYKDECVLKSEFLMNQVNVSISDRKCVAKTLEKAENCGELCLALQLPNGKIVTGKRSELFSAPAALLLNALKVLGKIDDALPLLSKNVIIPIQELKIRDLHNHNPRIHAEEVLIALAIAANTNPLASIALKNISKLKGCQAHSSYLLHQVDLNTFHKLGIDVTEEIRPY